MHSVEQIYKLQQKRNETENEKSHKHFQRDKPCVLADIRMVNQN